MLALYYGFWFFITVSSQAESVMQLDKLSIETRVRTGWAAIDLGMKLALQYWFRAYFVWLLLALPIFMVSHYFLSDKTILAYLIVWWFKPLFERPIVHMLSRELFSEKMSISKTLNQMMAWLWSGLLSSLTIRRLSVWRSFYMPVVMLEKLKANAYSKRTAVLGVKFSNEASWLTMVLIHVEAILSMGFLLLIAFLIPEGFDLWGLIEKETAWLQVASNFVCILVVGAIAPFYVAAGFMLYICRRIELEGWDIEICFRNWLIENERKV